MVHFYGCSAVWKLKHEGLRQETDTAQGKACRRPNLSYLPYSMNNHALTDLIIVKDHQLKVIQSTLAVILVQYGIYMSKDTL